MKKCYERIGGNTPILPVLTRDNIWLRYHIELSHPDDLLKCHSDDWRVGLFVIRMP